MKNLQPKFAFLCLVYACSVFTAYSQKIFNDTLSRQLEQIYSDDQKYRAQDDEVLAKYGWQSKEFATLQMDMMKQDSINELKVEKILDKFGWLDTTVVGEDGASSLWYVIQHADYQFQIKYLPMMTAALKEKKLNPSRFALLADRMALREGRKQIYASQIYSNAKTGENFVAPLDCPEYVDKRRAEMELPPLAQYLGQFGLTWNLEQYKKDEPSFEEKTWLLPTYKWDSSKPFGFIAFDKGYDHPEFNTTDTTTIYAFRDPLIKGGKAAIINYFKEHYKGKTNRNVNGQVKIYFFVNSEGKAGKFRIQTSPNNGQNETLPYNIGAHLFCLTREIRGWEPEEHLGKPYGYNSYLNFKIIDGRINEITP